MCWRLVPSASNVSESPRRLSNAKQTASRPDDVTRKRRKEENGRTVTVTTRCLFLPPIVHNDCDINSVFATTQLTAMRPAPTWVVHGWRSYELIVSPSNNMLPEALRSHSDSRFPLVQVGLSRRLQRSFLFSQPKITSHRSGNRCCARWKSYTIVLAMAELAFCFAAWLTLVPVLALYSWDVRLGATAWVVNGSLWFHTTQPIVWLTENWECSERRVFF